METNSNPLRELSTGFTVEDLFLVSMLEYVSETQTVLWNFDQTECFIVL